MNLFVSRWKRQSGLAAVAALAVPVVMVAGASVPSAQASVAVDQSYPAPRSGTYTVEGHGYGHGRGMSQHGAQGAAKQGLNYRQIVSFYYPQSTLSSTKARIRVLITADTTDDLVVKPGAGLKVRDVGARRSWELPTGIGATKWRARVVSGNDVVEYLKGSTWQRWSEVGTVAGPLQFQGASPLNLVLPSGSAVSYRGKLRAAASGSARDTVNVLSLNNYLRGVVPAEMPALWEPAAVQAQSVAARTYAMFNRQAYPKRAYHLCDTTSCQVYRGVAAEHPASDAAIKVTSRKYLTYDQKAIFSQFSASSGGWTVEGGRPYLTAQQDPYDGWSGNTNHNWRTTVKVSAIAAKYPQIGTLKRVRVVERDGRGQWKGRALKVILDGSKADVTISGETFRFAYGLKSSWFKLS